MSLRSCLFTRKVFDTDGKVVGTIRVEFIPEIAKSRRELSKSQMIPKIGKMHVFDPRKEKSSKDSSQDSSQDSSMESTEEF